MPSDLGAILNTNLCQKHPFGFRCDGRVVTELARDMA